MSQINILVVEDEPLHAAHLRMGLEQLGYNIIDIVDNGDDALAAFYATEPDIVLLDIKIRGQIDGIDIAHKIRNDETHARPVIFLTADKSQETFMRAKETHPSAFILKPFDKHSIQYAIELALVQFYKPNQQNEGGILEKGILDRENLFIKKSRKVVKVPIVDISYIEVESKYSTLVAKEGKFLIRISLKDLIQKLPYNLFIRVHRNYLVNIREIVEFDFEEYTVRLNDKVLPVGRTYRNTINEQLLLLS